MHMLKANIIWGLLLYLVTSPVFSQARGLQPITSENKQSCHQFVKKFYDWYLLQAHKDTDEPAMNLVLKSRPSELSPELAAALKTDSDAQASANGEIAGLDFDPFLSGQDPPSAYLIGNIHEKGTECRVEIYGVDGGKKTERPIVVPKLALQRGHWHFADFQYPRYSEPNSLLLILRKLRDDRAKKSK
jgi:Protein of unknown function (DUF3828)